MKAITTIVAAAALMGFGVEAQAMPVQPAPSADPQIIQVFGGCGPYGHRGPWGGCRPGGQWGGYGRGRACPPGFHLGPYGRRCWPSY
jgi:hypothetical protein